MVIAAADPVVVGIRELRAERARRLSLCGASTTTWVFVTSCMVVMVPRKIPSSSWTTLIGGAIQLVVHEAAVTRWWTSGSYK